MNRPAAKPGAPKVSKPAAKPKVKAPIKKVAQPKKVLKKTVRRGPCDEGQSTLAESQKRHRAWESVPGQDAQAFPDLSFVNGAGRSSDGRGRAGFRQPQDALDTMVAALKAGDATPLAVFGSDAADLLSTGNLDQDAEDHAGILAPYQDGYRFLPGDGSVTLLLGETDWPFPIPIPKPRQAGSLTPPQDGKRCWIAGSGSMSWK